VHPCGRSRGEGAFQYVTVNSVLERAAAKGMTGQGNASEVLVASGAVPDRRLEPQTGERDSRLDLAQAARRPELQGCLRRAT
jgi:hypothetical protein